MGKAAKKGRGKREGERQPRRREATKKGEVNKRGKGTQEGERQPRKGKATKKLRGNH